MNRFINALILCIIFLLFSEKILGQNKKALIVAIGNYPASSGFRNISSVNDVAILKSTLNSLGIPEKNIKTLVDNQAIKSNIIKALVSMEQENLHTGDFFYFHFSGHGQQVQDLNGDEIDGYDESLVPYDAQSEFIPGVYEGKNHLIDDELGELFNKIRLKLGPKGHFLCCIDACHSGTSTRHIGISRGVDVAMAPLDYRMNHMKNQKESNQSESTIVDESKMASMVGFFASMANQLNYEILADDGNNYGSLSYAFCKSIRSISPGSSYQQLFDKIRIQIQTFNNSQIPEAIGTLSQTILGGNILPAVKYYLVKEFLNSNTVVLNAGFLQGLRAGTIVGFYTPESRDSKSDSLITSGVVESSQFSTCKISIKKGISKTDAERAWVKIREDNFGDLRIAVQLKKPYSENIQNVIDTLLKLPFIDQVEKNPDLMILELENKVNLVTNNDMEIISIAKKSTENDIYSKLKSELVNYGQTQFIKKIAQENKDIKLEFEIILVNKGAGAINSSNQNVQKSNDGKIIFKVSDSIQVKVTNNGTKSAYYNMLDIQPNYRINVLIPANQESPSDYFIEPGQSITVPKIFRLDPPLGQELFKLVASRNPIDLRSLEQHRGIGNEQEQDPFSKVIQMSYYKNTHLMTRGYSTQVPAGQVNVFSVPFEIEKK